MFKNILVGADDSATALRAVEAAVKLAAIFDATLHIATAYKVEAVRVADIASGSVAADYVHPADALLDQLTALANANGVQAEIHAATGDPADAIIRVAERVSADLIVVGNKGMRGARRILGSVPNSIAHEAQCSVLIVDTTSGD
jgi:nucleotide-binding universal stress UspA family protein